MLGRKNVKKLTTMLGVALASSGIAAMAGTPAHASTVASAKPSTVASAKASPAVEDCGTGATLTRPTSLVLTCADGRMVASRLRWRSWNETEASATSTITWAASATRRDHTTADVELSGPVREADGKVLFTTLSLRVTGATPRGFIRDVTFSEAPVPALPALPAPTPSPAKAAVPVQERPRSLSPDTAAAASGTLNTAAIGGYWELAGGPSSVAETAEAITGAESSFEPGIIQAGMPYSTTGWGLWQITPGDSVPAYGEDYQLLDPWNNAEAAVYKYDAAGGFTPWTTYVDGAYENYLQYASTPNTDLTDPGQYEPINSAPAGTHNSSDPGSTYGPPIPGTPQLAFKVVFQANSNVLAGYSNSGSNFTTTLGLKAGTSPSVAELSDGTFEAAFEANNDDLGLSHLGGGTRNTTLGMKAGTSPAIAALPNDGWIAAFQDNASKLYLYDSSGDQVNTDLGMAAGTSPVIAVQADGSYRVVFQSNDNVLAGYNSSGSSYTTAYGMKAGTSPSLTAEPDGTYEAAFEANNDNLATVHIGTGTSVNPTTLGMDDATSPSITY
jgi:Lysozyme like domain